MSSSLPLGIPVLQVLALSWLVLAPNVLLLWLPSWLPTSLAAGATVNLQMGLAQQARYITSNSGATWFVAPYAYAPDFSPERFFR